MSHVRTFVSRLSALVIATAFALPLVACGDCGDHWHDDVIGGTLEVHNTDASTLGVDTVQVSVPYGPIESFDVFLAPGESAFIDLYPNAYDVDVIWSDHVVDTFTAVPIYDGQTTVLDVEA